MKIVDRYLEANQKAFDNPRIGDYWSEHFCPYFIIVDINDDKYTVLSCLGGPDSFTRKDELNAKIQVDSGHWTFDLSKSMVVNRQWITKAVKYESIDSFVADVINTEKTQNIVSEWREFKGKQILKQIENLQNEYLQFTEWNTLKKESL
jgi:hypothetical protein